MHTSTCAPARAHDTCAPRRAENAAAPPRAAIRTFASWGAAILPLRRAVLGAAALLAALLAATGLALWQASPALAHDELVGYSVEADVSTGTARSLTLSFSDEIMDVGTEIVVTGPDGTDGTDGAPEVSGRDVTQHLAAPLAEGEYDVAWRVVSSDGHPIQGALLLTIAADGDAVLAPDTRSGEGATDEAEHEHEHSDEAGDSGEAGHVHASTAEGTGSPVATVVSVAVVAIAAAGAIAAVIVGGRRRRRALEAAGGGAADPEPGTTGQGGAEQGGAEQSGAEQSGDPEAGR